jgi:hypothetical protein
MVDGRYWARGEKTRYALSDPEVQRYHQLVLKSQHDAADLLDVEERRDPAADAGLTAHAHLFGIAQPLGARPDLLGGSSAGQGRGAGTSSSTARCAAGRRVGHSARPGRRTSREPAIRLDGRKVGRSGQQG